MRTLLQDLRFALRILTKAPGFASIAVLSLALGIMATTAIYSVIHAVVLDPFPSSIRASCADGSMGATRRDGRFAFRD